ncbi:TIGR03943 family putative permease subunit [Actinomyces sp. ICM47]|uniref:TIGR03943 family putative permease subunit n=1 Tax=Actinomyces sp. ICM47 TaxID=936548 RepID=UPI0002733850|nr:TIGR03943 family protein [Actinomyces sp. ICM47]EJG15944.1 TIGR03943 family protein [Actinomyces sp. ICM47]
MKLLDRIAPTLEALSLAGLGAALAWMALSGRYGSFVPPSARLGILASGVGLLACALALSSRLEVGEGEHTHGEHTHAPASSRRGLTRASVAILAALILILPFRVSPSELAATTISARAADTEDEAEADPGAPSEDSSSAPPASADGGTQSATPGGSQSGGGSQASSSGVLELTTENFAAQVEELASHGKVHDGQRVELTGFVMSEASARGQASIPRLTQEESFAVARMAIWCCAADAYAIGFAVRWDGAVPAADSWVRVRGTLRLRGAKALVIDAESVEVTSAPDPEFVIQKR